MLQRTHVNAVVMLVRSHAVIFIITYLIQNDIGSEGSNELEIVTIITNSSIGWILF